MMGFLIFFHTLCSILLIVVILMQSGRGGGLTESFAAAESMFGAKTNAFMVRSTTVLAVVFFVTSLTLAYLSSKSQQSLLTDQLIPKKEIKLDMPLTETSETESQGNQ